MPNVEITIKTIVDKAIADLKRTAGAVDDVDNASQKGAGGVTDFSGAMIGLNQALEIAEKAFRAVKMVHDETVGVFIDYAAQVRDMSRATGESAEETSRLIQMADDMNVSYDSLRTSLQNAARQGIDISVESLKNLSEEYLTLEPGTERMQFLLDNFGRSGAEMGRLLELGAAGLDTLNKSIEGGLVLTEEVLKQARAHEILTDILNDEIESQKILAGIAVGSAESWFQLSVATDMRLANMQNAIEIERGYRMELIEQTTWRSKNREEAEKAVLAEIESKTKISETTTATEELTAAEDDLSISNKSVVTNLQALNLGLPPVVAGLESARAKANELQMQLQKLKDFGAINIAVNYKVTVSGDSPPGNP